MAQQNTPNTNSTLNYTEEQKRALAKMGVAGYSVSGYLPTASEWRFTESQLSDILLKTANKWLDDIQQVSIEVDTDDGHPVGFVWILRNSKHIMEDSQRDAAVKTRVTRFSDQIREFMDKFCYGGKKNKKLYQEKEDAKYSGIKIDLMKILKLEFDENGYMYGKEFGNEFKKKFSISATPVVDRSNPRDPKLRFITIRKEFGRTGFNKKLHPKKSYNV